MDEKQRVLTAKEQHTLELVKFGMQYWEDPLAQEYIMFSARQLERSAFLYGVITGVSGTVLAICLLKILLQ